MREKQQKELERKYEKKANQTMHDFEKKGQRC